MEGSSITGDIVPPRMHSDIATSAKSFGLTTTYQFSYTWNLGECDFHDSFLFMSVVHKGIIDTGSKLVVV